MQLNEFHAAIFACPCVFSDLPLELWWLSPGEGWDAVYMLQLVTTASQKRVLTQLG